MKFKGIRKWMAKRKAIKHMKHTRKCGDWHEVNVLSGIIVCKVCHLVFWDGIDKKAVAELRKDAKCAAMNIEYDQKMESRKRKSKQEFVDAITGINHA